MVNPPPADFPPRPPLFPPSLLPNRRLDGRPFRPLLFLLRESPCGSGKAGETAKHQPNLHAAVSVFRIDSLVSLARVDKDGRSLSSPHFPFKAKVVRASPGVSTSSPLVSSHLYVRAPSPKIGQACGSLSMTHPRTLSDTVMVMVSILKRMRAPYAASSSVRLSKRSAHRSPEDVGWPGTAEAHFRFPFPVPFRFLN